MQAYREKSGTQELVSWYTNDKNRSGRQTYTASAAEETSGDNAGEAYGGYSEEGSAEKSDESSEEHDYQEPAWKWKEYEEAEAVFVCRKCKEKVTRKAAVKETVKAATCTKDGRIVYTASVELNGKIYRDTKTVVVEKLGHQPFEPIAVTPATCEKDGIKIDCFMCPACKMYFKDREGTVELSKSEVVAPALGHNFAVKAWEWAKDYSAASVTFSCGNCGKEETRQGTVSHETTASCTEPGKTVYTATVNYDGQKYQDTKTVEGEMLPHKYSGEPTWEWSSDKSTATAVFRCEYGCGTTQKEQAVVEVRTETATCTVPGDTVYTATVTYDGRKYQDIQTAAGKTLPHKYSGEPTWDWSNDKSTANAVFRCDYGCGTTETVAGKIESKTENATCTVAGDTVYTATAVFNGKEYVDTQTAEGKTIPHSYGGVPEWRWETTPGEEPKAFAVFSCEYGCGHTEEVEADSVDAQETISEATCKVPGKKTYKATVVYNGTEYTEISEPIEGETVPHKCVGEPADWIWTGLDSDAEVTAVAVFECAYGCGESEEREGDFPNDPVIIKKATCTESGEEEYTAVVEDDDGNEWEDKRTKEIIGAHIMEWHEEAPATCGTAGTKGHWQCTSVCKGLFLDEEGETPVTEADLVIPATGKHKLVYDEKKNDGSYWCTECKGSFKIVSDGENTVLYSIEENREIILESEENDSDVRKNAKDGKRKEEEAAAGELPAESVLEESRKEDDPLQADGEGGQETAEAQEGQSEQEAAEIQNGQPEQETAEAQEDQSGQETAEVQDGQGDTENPEVQNSQPEQETAEIQEGQPGQENPEIQESQPGQENPEVQEGQPEQENPEIQEGQSEQENAEVQDSQPEQAESSEQESGDAADTQEEDSHSGVIYPAGEDADGESIVNLRAKSAADDAVQGQGEGTRAGLVIPIAALAAFTGLLLLLILRRKGSPQ